MIEKMPDNRWPLFRNVFWLTLTALWTGLSIDNGYGLIGFGFLLIAVWIIRIVVKFK